MNPVRDLAGRRVHDLVRRVVDARLATYDELNRARTDEQVRAALAAHEPDPEPGPEVLGPVERLDVDPRARADGALLDVRSGTVQVEAGAVLEPRAVITTAAPREDAVGVARADGLRTGGGDVVVRRGAWIGPGAVVAGPCEVGQDAVVRPGAVVLGDVPQGAVVEGNPARVVRRLRAAAGLPPAVDVQTHAGRLYLHAYDEVITPVLEAEGRIPDRDIAALPGLLAPGTHVVDVGANIGYTVLIAAGAIGSEGRVVAVEPHPDNVRLLRANVARHRLHDRVQVVAAAAWRDPGEVALSASDDNTGDHRSGVELAERDVLRVAAVRLDDVVPEDLAVGLVKLDTQGTEHIALDGARALLGRCRPTVITEFWPDLIRQQGDDPAAVVRGYRELGYTLEVLERPDLLPDADPEEVVAAVDAIPAPVQERGFGSLVLRPSA